MEETQNKPQNSLILGGNPMQTCIDACIKCAQICEECFTLCLLEPDVNERINCIKTLQDCSEICSTSACLMMRNSKNIKEVCDACAVICETCATECGMFKDEHCKSCADTCHHCANECIKMSQK